MRWIGIDPGKDGAVAVLQRQSDTAFSVDWIFDAPTINMSKPGGGTRRVYAEARMVELLQDCLDVPALPLMAAIEVQHAMPKQGVSSTFSTGEGYGLWKGMLAALKIPYVTVTPQAWKKVVLAGEAAKDKGAAIRVASRLYPGSNHLLHTERGRQLDGRADALCIAHWVATKG